MSSRSPEEVARRVLPWYLLPKFSNVLTSLGSKRDIESYKAIKTDLVVNEVTTVYIPGASRFLLVPHVEFEAVDNQEEKQVEVRVMDGWVHGFLPDGRYAKFLTKTLLKDEEVIPIKYERSYTDFAVDTVVRNYLRIRAGPLFAYKVERFGREHGVAFYKTVPDYLYGAKNVAATVAKVVIREKTVFTEITLPVYLYELSYKGEYLGVVPGIVPGILHLIGKDKLDTLKDNPDAKQALTDFVSEVAEVGKRVAPISSATLQATSKSRFTYIIGEADGPKTVFEDIARKLGKNRSLMWITGAPAYRGVRVNFYLNPHNQKIYMTISILPFSAPAVVVLNYPPFNIAPLAALVNQRMNFLRFNLNKVKDYLDKRGIDAGFYDMDYEVLSDAGITFDEVRATLKDGYPRLENLKVLLEKAEKLGYVGDLMAQVYGKESRIEEILVKELKPLMKKEAKKEMEKTIEKATEARDEADYEEEVML